MSKKTTSKPKYSDTPRYPVITQYENDFKKKWKDTIHLSLIEFKTNLERTLSPKKIEKALSGEELQKQLTKEQITLNLVKELLTDKNITSIPYKVVGEISGLSESSVKEIVLKNIKQL